MQISKIIEVIVFATSLIGLLLIGDLLSFSLLSLCGCLYFILSSTAGLSLERKFVFNLRNMLVGLVGTVALVLILIVLKIDFTDKFVSFQITKIEIITVFISAQFVLLMLLGVLLRKSGVKDV